MASTPPEDAPIPQSRVDAERMVLRCGIYRRETEHRSKKRKSYRTA